MEQGSNNFTSGRITSQDNVHFQYGVIEIRMKVPEVETGLWPAAWFSEEIILRLDGPSLVKLI